jgi:CheY-like chemotaxis protein
MSTASQSEAAGATILVVEDNASARMALETLLEALGHRVLVAGDANEAQAIFAAQAGSIDLLLSDMLLPRVNGPELYDLLKQQKPGLRCVIMSGYPLAEESERLRAHGIEHWLQKPFTLRDVAAMLEAVLRQL